MGSSESKQIKKDFGPIAAKPLDKMQERSVTRQMEECTTPRRVVSGMKLFPDNVKVQRAGAKQLSNLSFTVENVPEVLQKGGLKSLCKGLKKHRKDWKLCWFGASAIWNMARPAEARVQVGVTVDILLTMLEAHREREQVAHTVLGALSNLALEERNSERIVATRALELVFTSLECHRGSTQVMTSALGLIANLSINEEVAEELSKRGAVRWVLAGLKLYSVATSDDTRQMLVENGMAALSNLTFVDDFPNYLLRCSGVEWLCDIIGSGENFPLTEEEDLPLIRNILESVGVTQNWRRREAEGGETFWEMEIHNFYSLHQCSKMLAHKDMELGPVLRGLLSDTRHQLLLNVADGLGRTPLEYALESEDAEIVELLILSGARLTARADELAHTRLMTDVVETALAKHRAMVRHAGDAVAKGSGLHPCLAGVVVDYLSAYEMSTVFTIV